MRNLNIYHKETVLKLEESEVPVIDYVFNSPHPFTPHPTYLTSQQDKVS